MASVISAVVVFLVTWLLLWAGLMAGYLALVALVEYSRARWQQYQRKRQYRRAAAAELARINRETAASIQRISMAYMVAQQMLRHREENRPQ